MQKEKELIVDYFNTWQTIATASEIIKQVCIENDYNYSTTSYNFLIALNIMLTDGELQRNGQYYAKAW